MYYDLHTMLFILKIHLRKHCQHYSQTNHALDVLEHIRSLDFMRYGQHKTNLCNGVSVTPPPPQKKKKKTYNRIQLHTVDWYASDYSQ